MFSGTSKNGETMEQLLYMDNRGGFGIFRYQTPEKTSTKGTKSQVH